MTGAYVALVLACRHLYDTGEVSRIPVRTAVAAVSVGVVDGEEMLDLTYIEDSSAWVDFNAVMLPGGKYVEVQGTAEKEPFSGDVMNRLLALAAQGTEELFATQKAALS